MDCKVHGLAKSWTPLSNFHFLYNGLQETKILILSLPRLLPEEGETNNTEHILFLFVRRKKNTFNITGGLKVPVQ